MKKKRKIILAIIFVSLLLILSVGAYMVFQKLSIHDFIEISGYYDAQGNKISKMQSVVNGVEGVKYITLDIHVKNEDTVALTLRVKSMTPEEIVGAIPGTELKLNSKESGKFTTGLIDIEPYEGKAQEFCANVTSDKIPALREASVVGGCTNVVVEINPSGTFVISLNSSVESGTGSINPGCTESWTCEDWSVCSGNVQTRTCTDSNNCETTISKPALSQSCVSLQIVKFRTNSDGTYASGSWITYDSNNDGILECYVYALSTLGSSQKRAVTFTDMYSKEWSFVSPDMQLYTSHTTSYNYRKFLLGTGCELSSSPIEGYSGKEIYA